MMNGSTKVEDTQGAHDTLVLGAELAEAGFGAGAPGHVDARTRGIDRRLCARMLCGGCGRRGLRYEPVRRRGEYLALASCTRCGMSELF
jgi:hypothetical protein